MRYVFDLFLFYVVFTFGIVIEALGDQVPLLPSCPLSDVLFPQTILPPLFCSHLARSNSTRYVLHEPTFASTSPCPRSYTEMVELFSVLCPPSHSLLLSVIILDFSVELGKSPSSSTQPQLSLSLRNSLIAVYIQNNGLKVDRAVGPQASLVVSLVDPSFIPQIDRPHFRLAQYYGCPSVSLST